MSEKITRENRKFKVEICGINTGRLKVLKEKEKMELLKKAQAGDIITYLNGISGSIFLFVEMNFFTK